jgi:uncharacterized membrane protein YfcA
MSERISEIWKRINVWQKIAVIIFLIMWIGISVGISVSLVEPLWATLVFLCLLWLAYIVIAWLITRPYGQ